MNWYIAKMVFSIEGCGDGPGMPQFDSQLRLVPGADSSSALHNARQYGKETEVGFSGSAVKWIFIDVAELKQVELRAGEELYSRIVETDDAATYINYTREKALYLEACIHASAPGTDLREAENRQAV